VINYIGIDRRIEPLRNFKSTEPTSLCHQKHCRQTFSMSWAELGLDPRLLRSLGKQGFEAPTPVQAAAIPKALEGKDIVARARTGSGKTLAYLLPALHKVLNSGDTKSGWRALVLVPTRELCEQVRHSFLRRLQLPLLRAAAAAAALLTALYRAAQLCTEPLSSSTYHAQ